jgi:hypothetical protein
VPRQHELASFWQLCFDRPQQAQGHVFSNTFNAASDVEALLWLHYGVELGLYPQVDAQVIFRSNKDRLLRALKAVTGSYLAMFFPPALPTFLGEFSRSADFDRSIPPAVSADLDGLMPPEMYVRLGGLPPFGSVFDLRYADRLAGDLLNTVALDMLFHEVARAFSNPSCSVFSDLITFGTNGEWQELMEQNANPDLVLSGSGEKVNVLSAGYFAMVDHMGAMDELLTYCGDELTADGPALRDSQGDQTFLVLGERTRSIHGWRVKLDHPGIKGRFSSLTRKLKEQLDSDSDLMWMGFDSASLLDVVESLSARWLGDYSSSQRREGAA